MMKDGSMLMFLGFSIVVYAVNPGDPAWGVYASGVQQQRVGTDVDPATLDPCKIVYRVALMDNPKIVYNLKYGMMVEIAAGLDWEAAGSLARSFGAHFDDLPDGIVKLTPL